MFSSPLALGAVTSSPRLTKTTFGRANRSNSDCRNSPVDLHGKAQLFKLFLLGRLGYRNAIEKTKMLVNLLTVLLKSQFHWIGETTEGASRLKLLDGFSWLYHTSILPTLATARKLIQLYRAWRGCYNFDMAHSALRQSCLSFGSMSYAATQRERRV